MGADGARPHHAHAEFIADRTGFGIEIVDDFHVIGKKADGGDDRVAPDFPQIIADIRAKPGLGGGPAAALIDQLPVACADGFGDMPRGGFKLLLVRTRLGQRNGHAMGGKHQVSAGQLVAQ